jgi:dTDP-4-amino-4,6-dideoxygalactose transaminase
VNDPDSGPVPAASVPVLRPRLPEAERLLPYLRRIDAARIYSNYGPLAVELEQRLDKQLQLPDVDVITANSGFSALVAAILAVAGRASPERPYALLPAYTFIATASAAEQCGYLPLLADIDPDTWQLRPDALVSHPQRDRIGVALPVAPFGRPVELAPWQAAWDATGIPVAVDGAASFDRVEDEPSRWLGTIPVALSFHATKSFACGEGGAVVTRDAEISRRAVTALNFGFYGARDCLSANLNGKLSEYGAAVGLAELDGWGEKRAAMQAVAAAYRRAFAARGLEDRFVGTPVTSAAYVLFRAATDAEATRAEAALAKSGIDFRRWYGRGLQAQSYYATLPSAPLPVTAHVAQRLLGLPFAPDLDEAIVSRVVAALAGAVEG